MWFRKILMGGYVVQVQINGPQIASEFDRIAAEFPEMRFVFAANESDYFATCAEVEVMFDGFRYPGALSSAKSLRWAQSSGAGNDKDPLTELVDRRIVLTNAAGIHAIPVADTALMLLLSIGRGGNWAIRNQIAHNWQLPPAIWEPSEKTAGIVALGAIGIEIAKRVKSFGMNVIGVDVDTAIRSEYVDEIRSVSELPWLLGQSDVVFIAAPLTRSTRHMMNDDTFAMMRNGSVFISVSRGGLTDTKALIRALDSDRFFGVGLDVVDEEPLTNDHPLWDRSNVVITPHLGGNSPERGRRLADLFIENLRRYTNKKPLLNVVDLNEGY